MILEKSAYKISLTAGIIASLLIPITIISLLIINSEFGNLTLFSLSKLGEEGVQTERLFNMTIIIGGSLTFVFSLGLRKSIQFIGKSGFALFVAATLALTFIGVFNIPDPLHNFSAILFFSLMPISLLVMGLNLFRIVSGNSNATRINRSIGFGTIGSGLVMSTLGFLMIVFYPNRGIAIFELAVMFTSSFWLFVFGRKLLVSFKY